MKKGLHPEYVECTVRCSCGNTFTTRATKPQLRVELCNECHPFYTGQQKYVDTGGRVQRFSDKYGSASTAVAEREAAKRAARAEQAAAAAERARQQREAKAAVKAGKAQQFAEKAAAAEPVVATLETTVSESDMDQVLANAQELVSSLDSTIASAAEAVDSADTAVPAASDAD
ncbi:MAG: 50S ribosomal protein L31 [Actinomycetia bacterium]|nr:50S ribosomal protein L31 [Actinomycetes bacterium]